MRLIRHIAGWALVACFFAGFAFAQTSTTSPSPSDKSGTNEPVAAGKTAEPKSDDKKRFKIPAADKPKEPAKK
jgi:hypothetical protein